MSDQVAWTIQQWRGLVPISHSTIYEEIRSGNLQAIKVGDRTLITTPPKDYLASKPAGVSTFRGRRRANQAAGAA